MKNKKNKKQHKKLQEEQINKENIQVEEQADTKDNNSVKKESIMQEKKNKQNIDNTKKNSEEIKNATKQIFKQIIIAISIMLYFIIINYAYEHMKTDRLINDIKIFSGAFLVLGIYFLEKAYKNEKLNSLIYSIESFVLSAHSLSILYVITRFNFDFRLYLLTSSFIFSIYYILKSIVIYTKGERQYLKSLSDIPEIVKNEKPVVKKATKKRNNKNGKEKC